MSKNIFKFLLIISLFFATPYSFAQKSKSFLWKATSSTTTVYLLGSMHFAKKDLYPLNPAIEKAFNKSSSLVVEVNPVTIDQMKVQTMIYQQGVYRDGKTIKDTLDKKTFLLLKKFLEKNNTPIDSLMQYKPGFLSIQISTMQYMNLGFTPDAGIDIYFVKKAIARKIPILELETMEEQLTLLLNMPNEDLLLKQTIVNLNNSKKYLFKLVSLWKNGNSKGMEKLILGESLKKYPELLSVYELLLFKRNINMTKKIKKYLKTKKVYFVVIGAAHLVGKKGIVDLLKKAGYNIKQL